MRRKKVLVKNRVSDLIYCGEKVKISKDGESCFFEIGNQVTSDLGEAVAILSRTVEFGDDIWNLEIQDLNLETITPEKTLFWLTGGLDEWTTLENYNLNWSDCYLEFQQEFGFMIINALSKYKRLGDIRDYFIKYLNLPILYDFAISKNLIK